QDVISFVEVDVILVRRAVLVDVRDFVVAGSIGFHLKAGEARLHTVVALFLRGGGADAGVRRVQLADHLAHHVVHLLLVGYILHQRFINALHAGPVDAMHVGIVEAVLHDAPALIEDLLPLLAMVHFNARREGNAARLRTASGSSGTATGSAGAATA